MMESADANAIEPMMNVKTQPVRSKRPHAGCPWCYFSNRSAARSRISGGTERVTRSALDCSA